MRELDICPGWGRSDYLQCSISHPDALPARAALRFQFTLEGMAEPRLSGGEPEFLDLPGIQR